MNFFDLLSGMNQTVTIAFFLAILSAIIASLAMWARVRRIEAEVALKQDMISRGMSTEEIERVLKASIGSGCGRHRASKETAEYKSPAAQS